MNEVRTEYGSCRDSGGRNLILGDRVCCAMPCPVPRPISSLSRFDCSARKIAEALGDSQARSRRAAAPHLWTSAPCAAAALEAAVLSRILDQVCLTAAGACYVTAPRHVGWSLVMSLKIGHDLLYHFLAPAFLILTPFISFVTYNDYSYTAPEIWICLAGLAAIAFLSGCRHRRRLAGAGAADRGILLVLWVDLQFDWWDEFQSLARASGRWRLRARPAPVLRHQEASEPHRDGGVRDDARVHGRSGRGRRPASRIPAQPGGPRRCGTATEPSPRARPQLPVLVRSRPRRAHRDRGDPEDVPHGREMRQFLRDFFDTYGFRVFGRAYSHYTDTR